MSKTIINATASGAIGKNIDEVLRTEAGRALFVHLFHACGYNSSSLVLNRNTGEVAPLATECKEAQRLIYIGLRRLASRELLAVAEALAEVITPAIVASPKEEERK